MYSKHDPYMPLHLNFNPFWLEGHGFNNLKLALLICFYIEISTPFAALSLPWKSRFQNKYLKIFA